MGDRNARGDLLLRWGLGHGWQFLRCMDKAQALLHSQAGPLAVQLAVDTTMLTPVCRDGLPRPQAARRPGHVVAQAARRKRHSTYPELGRSGRYTCVREAVQRADHSTLSNALAKTTLTIQRGSSKTFSVRRCSSIRRPTLNPCCSSGCDASKMFSCDQESYAQRLCTSVKHLPLVIQ